MKNIKRQSLLQHMCLAIIIIALFSCHLDNDSDNNQEVRFDSTTVIQKSLGHILSQHAFFKTYNTQLWRIVKMPTVPRDFNFAINGMKCEMIGQTKNFSEYRDKPSPYIEVVKLKFDNINSVDIGIILRSFGLLYELRLERDAKSDWKIVKTSESEI